MRNGVRSGRPRRTAGWSLLELVLTILILTVALLLSGPLLQAGLRHMAFEQERILEAEATVALKQLRADVTAAVSAINKDEDLLLVLPGKRRITYGLQGDRLRRRLDDPEGGGERTVLDGVGSFGWTRLPGSGKPSLLIQLTWLRTRRPGPLAKDGFRVVAPREMHQESLVLTLRGGGGVGW